MHLLRLLALVPALALLSAEAAPVRVMFERDADVADNELVFRSYASFDDMADNLPSGPDRVSPINISGVFSTRGLTWDGQQFVVMFERDADVADNELVFRSKVKTLIEDRVSRAGGMTAQTMKQLDSELGEMARRYGRSSVASEQELGDAFLEAQRLLRDQVARNSPAAADALKRINEGWANLIRVEKAGAAAVNNDGVFTPAQLNLAIRGAEQSVRKRGTARGTALMQDLGSAGSMLGNLVPNSGTVDRLLLGGAGLGAGMYDPLIPAGLLTGAGMYSAPMQSLLRFAVTTPRPASAQRITGLLNETSPMFAPAGGLLGLEVLE